MSSKGHLLEMCRGRCGMREEGCLGLGHLLLQPQQLMRGTFSLWLFQDIRNLAFLLEERSLNNLFLLSVCNELTANFLYCS